MFSLFKLQLKKTVTSPTIMFPFIMPVIFTLVYIGAGFNSDQEIATAVGLLISLTIMQNGIQQYGGNFMNVKETVLIRRIGATKLRKSDVIGAFILVSLVMTMIGIFWILLLYTMIYDIPLWSSTYSFQYGLISWPQFIYGVIAAMLVSFSVGSIFVSYSHSSESYQSKSSIYFFGVALLGGALIPAALGVSWMHYVSLIFPNSYVAHFIAASIGGQPTFDISNGYQITNPGGGVIWNYQPWEASLNVFMPLIASAVILPLAIKKFNWDS